MFLIRCLIDIVLGNDFQPLPFGICELFFSSSDNTSLNLLNDIFRQNIVKINRIMRIRQDENQVIVFIATSMRLIIDIGFSKSKSNGNSTGFSERLDGTVSVVLTLTLKVASPDHRPRSRQLQQADS